MPDGEAARLISKNESLVYSELPAGFKGKPQLLGAMYPTVPYLLGWGQPFSPGQWIPGSHLVALVWTCWGSTSVPRAPAASAGPNP